MKIITAFCQDLIEKELEPLSYIPFTLHGDNRPNYFDLQLNPINVYWHSEPEAYFGNHSWIRQNYHMFNYVLTWNQELLRDLPNAMLCPFGTSAFHDKVDPLSLKDTIAKENKVTFIRGAKHAPVLGHHLRHELYDRRNEITGIKHEFYDQTTPAYASSAAEELLWFAQRTSIFQSPFFHICIENTSHPNYFTEKIIDCFLFRTVPIYFGAPNIGSYFDKDGIISFGSVSELIDICNHLTVEDYNDRILAVWRNQAECLRYLNLGKTILNKITRIMETNHPEYFNQRQ